MKSKIIYIKLLTLTFFCFSCKEQNILLKEVNYWKYSDGFHIGDVIDFNNNNFIIKNDTIFHNNIPIAKFVKIQNRLGIADNKLTIQDLKTSEIGNYSGK
ncbi:hypothetical protein [Faecalibacter sp. LW9]|uniref:hypothetical protein n=1 Tax=Faecalibacter sp. LW9 TaxID=3103144 RepID=UPI002AFF70F4|nr:hypothetical protein [Faecalibacter sp. LW9]